MAEGAPPILVTMGALVKTDLTPDNGISTMVRLHSSRQHTTIAASNAFVLRRHSHIVHHECSGVMLAGGEVRRREHVLSVLGPSVAAPGHSLNHEVPASTMHALPKSFSQ